MMDIRYYSENELSLWIFNDEGLYKMRRVILKRPEVLDDFFKYTDEQLEIALKDIKEDLEGE